MLGFNAAATNRVIDLAECLVLRPELFALLKPLRGMIGRLGGRAGEVQLTLTDQGIDVALKGVRTEGLDSDRGTHGILREQSTCPPEH